MINSILILLLASWSGYLQYQTVQMQQEQSPLEEIIPTYPTTQDHLNISETFYSEIVFSYSGNKGAYYFIEWVATNSEDTIDNITPLQRNTREAISTISEKDGRKTEVKQYDFSKKGIYKIDATIYYFSGTPAGTNEEELTEYIKTNGGSKLISYKVKVGITE